MATVNNFYNESNWEQSSGPVVSRQFETGDLWPHGAASEIGGGDKDTIDPGKHPILAIGKKADRAGVTAVGAVMTIEKNLVQLNIGKGFISRQFVANILTYNAGNPATWAAALNVGMPVYIDDSAALSEGVTLSLSPLNSADSPNPFAGVIVQAQDQYDDSRFAGAGANPFPITASAGATVEKLVCVMLK